MAAEETLMQVRREKHRELNSGTYPLASSSNSDIGFIIDYNHWHNTKTSIDPQELGMSFTLHGRVSAFRKSGGITFIKIIDNTRSLQLICSKSILLDYDKLHLIDLGDFIEVNGPLTLSKTGEKSLLVTQWKVLTKSHRPPPEKFVGITDPELKYRKRYLDLMSSEESRARFVVRSALLRKLRSFMENEDFMEVETSTLSSISSGANAKPFTTHHNALDIPLRLRIAPELNLKRLLVGGFNKVYEIGRAYRNEGIDTRHNPEFTMMESYEAYGNFDRLLSFTQDMLLNLDYALEYSLRDSARDYYLKWKSERTFTLDEFRVVPMSQAVSNACSKAGIILELNGPITIHSIKMELPSNNPRLASIDIKSMWHDIDIASSDGEAVAALFEHVAEPFLTEDYRTEDGKHSLPVFITEYPKAVCPLARSNDKNPDICDRFELFVDGRELANAFQELNDPDEQAARFQQQLESNNKDPMDLDADYIEALEYGMPPAVGFGMGIDRLVMLLTNTTSIKDVILFPTLKPIKLEDV